jgi:hypothetical protein
MINWSKIMPFLFNKFNSSFLPSLFGENAVGTNTFSQQIFSKMLIVVEFVQSFKSFAVMV